MTESSSNLLYRRLAISSPRVVVRVLVLSILWVVLSGNDVKSWIVGAPAVLLAVCWSFILAPASYWPLSFGGACRFIPFFLGKSFHSGIDVMRRTFSPVMPVNPGLVDYATFLPDGPPRILFANTISLLPGTLSVDLQGNVVIIHTIDKNQPIWTNIHNLEWHVAALFGVHPGGQK